MVDIRIQVMIFWVSLNAEFSFHKGLPLSKWMVYDMKDFKAFQNTPWRAECAWIQLFCRKFVIIKLTLVIYEVGEVSLAFVENSWLCPRKMTVFHCIQWCINLRSRVLFLVIKNAWSQGNYDGQNITKFERCKHRFFKLLVCRDDYNNSVINDVCWKHKSKNP